MAARYPISSHCDGHTFCNTEPAARELKGLAEVIKWKWRGQAAGWPQHVDNDGRPALATTVPPGEAMVTAIGHATLLLQLPGLNVLTDPVFSERASPSQHIGPRRVRRPGLDLAALPPVDVVLISHNHYDHLDAASVRALWQRDRPLFVVPLGNGALLRQEQVERIVELDWEEQHQLPGGAAVRVVEAQHWSARGLLDRNKSLWGGFLLEAGGVSVYFAGDTGYAGHFARHRAAHGPVDIALLPIGAYAPRWFMRAQHMDPAEAVQAHVELGARQSVGIHFGTFQLTDEPIDEPPALLAQALAERQLEPGAFQALLPGDTLRYVRP